MTAPSFKLPDSLVGDSADVQTIKGAFSPKVEAVPDMAALRDAAARKVLKSASGGAIPRIFKDARRAGAVAQDAAAEAHRKFAQGRISQAELLDQLNPIRQTLAATLAPLALEWAAGGDRIARQGPPPGSVADTRSAAESARDAAEVALFAIVTPHELHRMSVGYVASGNKTMARYALSAWRSFPAYKSAFRSDRGAAHVVLSGQNTPDAGLSPVELAERIVPMLEAMLSDPDGLEREYRAELVAGLTKDGQDLFSELLNHDGKLAIDDDPSRMPRLVVGDGQQVPMSVFAYPWMQRLASGDPATARPSVSGLGS